MQSSRRKSNSRKFFSPVFPAAKQHCLRRDFAARAYSWASFLNFHRVSWLTWLSLCFTWICIMSEIYIYIHIHISYIWNPSIWDRFRILFYYYSIYIGCGPPGTSGKYRFFLGTEPPTKECNNPGGLVLVGSHMVTPNIIYIYIYFFT